jgi:hypothetical protein
MSIKNNINLIIAISKLIEIDGMLTNTMERNTTTRSNKLI